MKSELTLQDHAEIWWMEQGNIIPPRGTKYHKEMYERWVQWAFNDFDFNKNQIVGSGA